MIRQICSRPEPVSVNLRFTVNQNHGFEAYSKDIDGPINWMELELRQTAELVIRVEDVSKHFPQKSSGVRPGIQRQFVGLVVKTERPQIVDAQNVIRMRMRVENRIQMHDPFADCLNVKI